MSDLMDLMSATFWLLGATELPELGFLEQWGATLANVALVAIGLGFVIFVHELGHFLAAKAFGVKCEKFYIGFDVPIRLGPIRLPAKLLHFQWGETEYGIGAIPLGGYVKMLGQDDNPQRAAEESARIRTDQGDGLTPQGLDPRSYPAKPVYARMIIISAGVIMNLIFGVLFAAAAFRYGVSYTPTVVGQTVPGDPAWASGIQPGDQVTKVGSLRESDQLRYSELIETVRMHGLGEADVPLPLVINRNGERQELQILGTRSHDPDENILTIGISFARTTQIASNRVFEPFVPHNAAAAGFALPDLHLDETIVAIDGHNVDTLPVTNQRALYDLQRHLHPNFDRPVKLTVEAADGQSREIDWQPVPRLTLGFGLDAGPVKAIAKDSPAAQQQVQIGDRILAVDGQPVTDVLTLPMAIASKRGEEVQFEMERLASDGSSSRYEFTYTVPDEFVYSEPIPQPATAGLELPGSGLAIYVKREISAVDESLGENLQVGDRLMQFRVLEQQSEPVASLLKKFGSDQFFKEQPLDSYFDAIYVDSMIQMLPIGTRLELAVKRGEEIKIVEATIRADDVMNFERGVSFAPATGIYRVPELATALNLGVQEVGTKMTTVFSFLRKLVTRDIKLSMLGGPGVIFYVATKEANEGVSRLLLFLTMLSANLAVLNFLPIPALDGGHFLFLTWEAIRGKPVDEELQMRLTLGGVLALLCLMVFVLINDVINLAPILG